MVNSTIFSTEILAIHQLQKKNQKWNCRTKIKKKTTRGEINITECDKDKANVLANFFRSMFTNEPEGDLPTFKDANLEFEFEERV